MSRLPAPMVLVTPSQIAREINAVEHRVRWAIHTLNIRPVVLVGKIKAFYPSVCDKIREEINRIDKRR